MQYHLDAVRRDGSNECTVYFGNKYGLDGAIKHSGDNLTGEGSGDDEVIEVNLTRLSADLAAVVFVINVFTSGKSFADVSGEYCRLLDCTQESQRKEFARVDGFDSGAANGFVFSALIRSTRIQGFWEYHAVGIHGAGMNRCTEMTSLANEWVVDYLNKPPPARSRAAAPAPAAAAPAAKDEPKKAEDGCCLVV